MEVRCHGLLDVGPSLVWTDGLDRRFGFISRKDHVSVSVTVIPQLSPLESDEEARLVHVLGSTNRLCPNLFSNALCVGYGAEIQRGDVPRVSITLQRGVRTNPDLFLRIPTMILRLRMQALLSKLAIREVGSTS